MNIPKRAIELAIEGGWEPFKTIGVVGDGSWDKIDFERYGYSAPQNLDKTLASINIYRIALTSEFWQSLGKSLGWSDLDQCGHKYPSNGDGRYSDICKICGRKFTPGTWQEKAHRFYDLILTNVDTEQYWAELLAK